MSATGPVLRFTNVAKAFRAGVRGCMGTARVLEGVSFGVAGGEIVVIVARPGGGTSTVLLLAAGMLRPDVGTIERPPPARIARVHPESGAAIRAAIADVLRDAPALLLLERVERPNAERLGPMLESLARAAAWRGSAVLLAAHPGDPVLHRLGESRQLRLAGGVVDAGVAAAAGGEGARRIAERH